MSLTIRNSTAKLTGLLCTVKSPLRRPSTSFNGRGI